MIDFKAELDRLATDLAVLDVARGAGTRIDGRLETFTAVRARDHVKLHAAGFTRIIRGYAQVDHRLETVFGVNALRICRRILPCTLEFEVAVGWLLGAFHRSYTG